MFISILISGYGFIKTELYEIFDKIKKTYILFPMYDHNKYPSKTITPINWWFGIPYKTISIGLTAKFEDEDKMLKKAQIEFLFLGERFKDAELNNQNIERIQKLVDNLPSTLKFLSLQIYRRTTENKLIFDKLPSKLEVLILNNPDNECCVSAYNLPINLRYLHISSLNLLEQDWLEYLPANLETAIFECSVFDADQSYMFLLNLPHNLKTLKFKFYRCDDNINNIPDSIEHLQLYYVKSYFIDQWGHTHFNTRNLIDLSDFNLYKVPKNCKILEINDKLEQYIDKEKLKRQNPNLIIKVINDWSN